jgi:predicted nucleic acid-binding protein
MKARIYLETTVVSYLTARPSRDLIQAAHQRITLEWWESRAPDFELYASQLVVREASLGDPEFARERLRRIEGIPLLDVNEAATRLAEALLSEGPMPTKAADDALHLALAAVHGMDYLLTWNCRHLANAEMADAAGRVIRKQGFGPPRVCTPEELMGE